MKFLPVILFVAAIFVAGSNAGSPSGSFGISSSSIFIGSSSGTFVDFSSPSSMVGSSSALNSVSSSSSGVSSSSSEPAICYVVAQVVFEFNVFTSNILKLYILNFQRSDDSTVSDKTEKLTRMVEIVESVDEVPEEDKEKLRNLYERGVEGRDWTDQFTHANIWDCFVSIFTGALGGVLAP